MVIEKISKMEYAFNKEDLTIKIDVTRILDRKEVVARLTIGEHIYKRVNLTETAKGRKLYGAITQDYVGFDKYIESDEDFVAMLLGANGEILTHIKGTEVVVEDDELKAFLANPRILNDVNEIIRQSREDRVVGEHSNLLLFFLSMLSSKTKYPTNIEFTGKSSSGKTFLAVAIANVFHQLDKVDLTGGSKTALKYNVSYTNEDGNPVVDIDQKILMLLEKDESEELVKSLKPIMSHDKFELSYGVPETGPTGDEKRRTAFYLIRGYACVVTMTTANPNDSEQITRQLIASTDTSQEKMKAVTSSILDSALALPVEVRLHKRLPVLQHALHSLKRTHVINPFFRMIGDMVPTEDCRIFRDLKKFKALIEAMTLLHRENRLRFETDGCSEGETEEVLISSLEDNIIALSVIDDVFRATFRGVSEASMEVYRALEEIQTKHKKKSVNDRSLLEYLHGIGMRMTRTAMISHITTLADKGMVGYEQLMRGICTYYILPGSDKYDAIVRFTPFLMDSVDSELRTGQLFTDERTLKVLRMAEIPENFEMNKDLLDTVNRRYAKAKLKDGDIKRIAALLHCYYCPDPDSFVQNIVNSKVKKVFVKPQWWLDLSCGGKKSYTQIQELMTQLRDLMVDQNNSGERDTLLRAIEEKWSETDEG